jgi:tetratricopeptide (TPR) repeat protein
MPISRTGRTSVVIFSTTLLVICLATNAYLAYRLTFPPRTLQVKIIYDPSNPPAGIGSDKLKAQVESVSGFFEKADGIRIVVTGFVKLKLLEQTIDPDVLRHYIELRTPRDSADILVAFWVAPPGDSRIGSALPYSSIAIVKLDPRNPSHTKAIIAHQFLTLFGVPGSADTNSVMFTPPTTMNLDSDSAKDLTAGRLFNFHRGLADMNRRTRGNIMDSIERFLKAQPPADKSRSAHIILAELLMRDSQFQASADEYRKALRSDSNSMAAHLGLSLALTQSGDYTEAETEARAAIKLDPNQGDAYYRLGFGLVRAGNPEAAIPELRKAIDLQPNSIRDRTGLAVAYAASIGEFEAADREFQEALKIDPQNATLLADVDYVKKLRQRYNQQLEVAQAQIKANPNDLEAHDQAALLLLRIGKVGQALAEAHETLKIGPNNWHPHYTLALALYAAHDYTGSSTAMADAKRLGSGDRPFLEDSLRAVAATHPAK